MYIQPILDFLAFFLLGLSIECSLGEWQISKSFHSAPTKLVIKYEIKK